jgi:adenylate cyclase class 2
MQRKWRAINMFRIGMPGSSLLGILDAAWRGCDMLEYTPGPVVCSPRAKWTIEMPVEIEAKMKVADHADVRQRLRDAGAKYESNVLETNTFFDTSDRALMSHDKGLRLRQQTDAQTHEEKCKFTFKGPRQKGDLKSRPEHEVQVSDPCDAAEFLEALGFAKLASFQKRRESWTLEKCQVELDEVPHLGTFVEIEGPDEAAVMKVREMLQLRDAPMIHTSYISLLMSHLKEKGINQRDVTFK